MYKESTFTLPRKTIEHLNHGNADEQTKNYITIENNDDKFYEL